MKVTSKSIEFAGKKLTLETGKLAKLATAAVVARLGDTMVLATVVASRKETTLDYFPLSVEYIERLYAGGRIKGSRWVKRQGRPTDEAVLTGRLIDRSIRPLFPKEYKNDVQVVVTVLSVDGENESDVLAIIAVSAALAMSPIPWKGPIGAIRMGYKDGEYLYNPGGEILAQSQLDLVATQSREKTLMLEAGALQVTEEVTLEAITKAHDETQKLISFIEEFAKEAGKEKVAVAPDESLLEYVGVVEKTYKKDIENLVALRAENEGSSADQELLVEKIFADVTADEKAAKVDKKTIAKAVEKVFFKIIRANILEKGKRPDGRKIDEIRPLSAEIDVLPRVHGSGLFQRGDTQALSIVTLGAGRMEQLLESPEGEEKKRYIHHYSFPPYSVGETGRVGFLSRREIGHGALGERALLGVIPSKDVFPYTIQVNSEVLASNGSTSMASTCGSTLALMTAGVPLLAPVAGIAMGRVQDGEKYVLLTDILGLEDFSGDMDFKVAGSTTGITAIQLDVKDGGLTPAQIKEVFERARDARMKILDVMMAAIDAPRPNVSEFAPKVAVVHVPVERIGEIIGPGGRVIKNIIATTGADVEVEDDGTVNVSGTDADQVQQAVSWIQGLVREVKVGEIFEDAEVKRILPFGAFVEFLPGKEGMVHVSKMTDHFVQNPSEVVQIGDKVKVWVQEIDDQGRINLSMIDPSQIQPRQPRPDFREGPREQRDFRPSTPVTAGADRPKHPLAMQFEREKRQQKRPYGPKRDYNR